LPNIVGEEDDSPESSSSSSSDGKVFGVFDGHGGPEVARLCGLYMVSVLTQQPTWKQGMLHRLPEEPSDPAESKMGKALRCTFHALDRMVDDPARRYVLCTLPFC
jgi:serine/threonine protein phosphatase PrpC